MQPADHPRRLSYSTRGERERVALSCERRMPRAACRSMLSEAASDGRVCRAIRTPQTVGTQDFLRRTAFFRAATQTLFDPETCAQNAYQSRRKRLKLPGLGEGLEAAVIRALGLGREAATGQLAGCQVVLQAFAADTLALATAIGARAVLEIRFLSTLHDRFSSARHLVRVGVIANRTHSGWTRVCPATRPSRIAKRLADYFFSAGSPMGLIITYRNLMGLWSPWSRIGPVGSPSLILSSPYRCVALGGS